MTRFGWFLIGFSVVTALILGALWTIERNNRIEENRRGVCAVRAIAIALSPTEPKPQQRVLDAVARHTVSLNCDDIKSGLGSSLRQLNRVKGVDKRMLRSDRRRASKARASGGGSGGSFSDGQTPSPGSGGGSTGGDNTGGGGSAPPPPPPLACQLAPAICTALPPLGVLIAYIS